MAVLSMSKQEFGRLDVLLRVQSGRLRVSDACALIALQRRQVFRKRSSGDMILNSGLCALRRVDSLPAWVRACGGRGCGRGSARGGR